MTTAKDKERKDAIQNALRSLEGETRSTGKALSPNMKGVNSESGISALHPSTHARLLGAHKVPIEVKPRTQRAGGDYRSRPASAQRRPSMVGTGLDIIHEVRVIIAVFRTFCDLGK